MKFLKEHLYDAIKIYITQIAITIFSFMMYTAGASVNSDEGISATIQIAISVFSILFYFTLLYTAAWDWGAKDKIRIDAGRMQPHKTKGLKIALMANLLNFILVLISLTSFLFCINGAKGFWVSLGTTTTTIMRFTAAIFQGLIHNVFGSLGSTLQNGEPNYLFYVCEAGGFAFMFAMSILVIHLAYYFGTREFKIFGFLKSNKK